MDIRAHRQAVAPATDGGSPVFVDDQRCRPRHERHRRLAVAVVTAASVVRPELEAAVEGSHEAWQFGRRHIERMGPGTAGLVEPAPARRRAVSMSIQTA